MITLYSTDCPNCKVLKAKLEQSGIPYETVTDTEIVKYKGIKSVPMLKIDGKLLNFYQAVKFINEYQH